MLFRPLANISKLPDLRKRLFITFGFLALTRLGVQIPVPGVHLANILAASGAQNNGLLDFVSLFTGGGLARASVFSLGVMPYITSSIIMQLMTAIWPPLERMVKEGPEGRHKFRQMGRIGTVLVSLLQGVIYANFLIDWNASAASPFLLLPNTSFMLLFVVSVVAGTLLLMWIGEQITEMGVGNGVSLVILAGILSRLPSATFQLAGRGMSPITNLTIVMLFALVVGLVVFEELGLRKVPVEYPRQQGASNPYAMRSNYLPFKVNPTNVVPIIFASAVLVFPIQVIQWLNPTNPWVVRATTWLQPSHWVYSLIYFILIIFFAYFYIEIELNPKDIAENLRRQGGFIPGVRPGKETQEYLDKLLSRLTLPGAVFLGVIALLPNIIISRLGVSQSIAYLMGGTSLLITVSASLETLKQVEAHLQMHHLEGFLSNKRADR